MSQKRVLLDGYSLLYRAYHALQSPMSSPDGTPTNAVHGFVMMMLKVLEEEKPDCIAVAFDMHAPTFRNVLYSEYKGTRKPMPDDLRAQDPIIRELIVQMNVPILECEGYEADDILGTISLTGESEDVETLLVTGDRDSFQLVGEHTTVLYTKKGITDTIRVTPDYILENYGIKPKQLIDVKSLMGDASDNIPGISGIGEKTALKLVAQYGTVESVLEHAQDQKGKLKERLTEGVDSAMMSRKLAEIDRHAPVCFDPEAARPDRLLEALPRMRALGMNAAARRLTEVAKLFAKTELPAAQQAEETALPDIEVYNDANDFAARIIALTEHTEWAAVCVTDGMTVATDSARLSLPFGGDLLTPGVSDEEAWNAISPLLASECAKYLHDARHIPVDIHGDVLDTMLAAYALNPQRPSFDAQALCEQEQIGGFAAHPASAIAQLAQKQCLLLKQNELEEIYRDIEMPLSHVLRHMENEGFLVDTDTLIRLEKTFSEKITELSEQIFALAGARINLNSPKQLAELLFTKLGIPSPNKRKISTGAEVLETLAEEYPICGLILEYRRYQKLSSTYTQTLIRMQDAEGRIHTRFDQVSTATGRISSLEPNLQNIPVRTELGRAIRAAFIARPGWKLVDADYSQIELRVLAHMSGDQTMIKAFLNDEDIHTRTAAEVFGLAPEEVTPELRSAAKAVNFGIVYGISEFSLAKNTGVSRYEAKEFIDRYFKRYPDVKRYMDRAVETGREQGYVTTMMNRRRYLPELMSGNFNLRAFGERCAMNSPIQGTAADIIKLAMIRVDEALRREGLRSKLLLQVHDELIIEAPEDEVEHVTELLRGCMENVLPLTVPLRTEITIGGDWRACK